MTPKLSSSSLKEQQSLLTRSSTGYSTVSASSSDPEYGSSLSMEDAMDRLGFGPFQQRLVWAAGLCVMADGLEILLLSVLTVVLTSEWSLQEWQTSLLMSSVFAGALLGSLVLGQLADHCGRKPIFILTAAIIALLGIVTGFASNFGWLILCRWGVGFGVGGGTVPFDTLIEFLPRNQRGHHMLFIWYFWTTGTMLVVLLAYFTVGEEQTASNSSYWEGWRLFVIACALPCLASMILGILWVPESPRWLLTARNDPKAALTVLRDAAIINGKDPYRLFPEGTQLLEPDQAEAQEAELWDLFRPKWCRTTLYLFGTWFGFAILYYGGVIVTTLVFASNSAETTTTESSSYHFEYGALFIANAAEILATILMVQYVDQIGRIPIQTACYLGGGILVVLLCLLAGNTRSSDPLLFGAMVVLAFGVRMLNMAASCTTWVSTAELFTTDIRSTGHSAANAVARFGGFLVPYVVSASAPLPFIGAFMMVVALGTAFCASRLPETKGKELGVASSSEDIGATT